MIKFYIKEWASEIADTSNTSNIESIQTKTLYCALPQVVYFEWRKGAIYQTPNYTQRKTVQHVQFCVTMNYSFLTECML